MTCTHLQQLYKLCEQSDVRLSSADLIHFVCHQCNQEEVCPSMLTDEYDARHADASENAPQSAEENSAR